MTLNYKVASVSHLPFFLSCQSVYQLVLFVESSSSFLCSARVSVLFVVQSLLLVPVCLTWPGGWPQLHSSRKTAIL